MSRESVLRGQHDERTGKGTLSNIDDRNEEVELQYTWGRVGRSVTDLVREMDSVWMSRDERR